MPFPDNFVRLGGRSGLGDGSSMDSEEIVPAPAARSPARGTVAPRIRVIMGPVPPAGGGAASASGAGAGAASPRCESE